MKIIDHGDGFHEAVMPANMVELTFRLGLGAGAVIGASLVGATWAVISGIWWLAVMLIVLNGFLAVKVYRTDKRAVVAGQIICHAFDLAAKSEEEVISEMN